MSPKLNPFDKTQAARLLDVFLLGPFMIWFGVKSKEVPEATKAIMVMAGIGTILYNGDNYIKNVKSKQENL